MIRLDPDRAENRNRIRTFFKNPDQDQDQNLQLLYIDKRVDILKGFLTSIWVRSPDSTENLDPDPILFKACIRIRS